MASFEPGISRSRVLRSAVAPHWLGMEKREIVRPTRTTASLAVSCVAIDTSTRITTGSVGAIASNTTTIVLHTDRALIDI